jgi:hypothetical protein
VLRIVLTFGIEGVGDSGEPSVFDVPDYGMQELFLASEVGVDRSFRESGRISDLLQGCCLEALAGEDLVAASISASRVS